MKIRKKLITLVLALAGTLLLAGLAYAGVTRYIAQVETEKNSLRDILISLNRLKSEANRLDTLTFDEGRSTFSAAVREFDDSIARIESLTALASVNADVSAALAKVSKIKGEVTARISDIDASLVDLEKDMVPIIGDDKSRKSVPALYEALYDASDSTAAYYARFSLTNFLSKIVSLDVALNAQIVAVSGQLTAIGSAVDRMRVVVMALLIAGILLIMLVGTLAAMFFSGRIASDIEALGSGTASLTDGDLTRRFADRESDEIGDLARSLNRFLASLSGALAGIRQASARNLEVKGNLGSAALDAASAVTQIEANSDSITRQIERLNGQVEVTNGEIESVSSQITALRGDVRVQQSTLGDSTEAINQVLEALNVVVGAVDSGKTAADRIAETTGEGQKEFSETYARVTSIHDSASLIREIVGVMAGIAARTNLLAMNAAIEAAHAGEYGQGFAVVADEIRSLAEASSARSKEIGKNVANIVADIEKAKDLAGSTNRNFDRMHEECQALSALMRSVQDTVMDTFTDGQRVADSIRRLNEISRKIDAGSDAMEHSSSRILAVASDLGRISTESYSNISEINSGIHGIGESVRSVSAFADEVGEVSVKLDGEIAFFKVGA